jgi:hypothetical protein
MRRPTYSAVVSTLALLVALSGATYAAIPDGQTGVVHACYKLGARKPGALRVIDAQSGQHCTAGSEKPLDWTSGLSVYGADGVRLGPLISLNEADFTLDYLDPATSVVYRIGLPGGAYLPIDKSAFFTGDACTGTMYVDAGDLPVASFAFDIATSSQLFVVSGPRQSAPIRSELNNLTCTSDVEVRAVSPTRAVGPIPPRIADPPAIR